MFDAPDEVIRFLALRLVGKGGDRGVSSDALIALAAGGLAIGGASYPRDMGDFGRCCEAFALAPTDLRKRMLPVLAAWGHDVARKVADRGW